MKKAFKHFLRQIEFCTINHSQSIIKYSQYGHLECLMNEWLEPTTQPSNRTEPMIKSFLALPCSPPSDSNRSALTETAHDFEIDWRIGAAMQEERKKKAAAKWSIQLVQLLQSIECQWEIFMPFHWPIIYFARCWNLCHKKTCVVNTWHFIDFCDV